MRKIILYTLLITGLYSAVNAKTSLIDSLYQKGAYHTIIQDYYLDIVRFQQIKSQSNLRTLEKIKLSLSFLHFFEEATEVQQLIIQAGDPESKHWKLQLDLLVLYVQQQDFSKAKQLANRLSTDNTTALNFAKELIKTWQNCLERQDRECEEKLEQLSDAILSEDSSILFSYADHIYELYKMSGYSRTEDYKTLIYKIREFTGWQSDHPNIVSMKIRFGSLLLAKGSYTEAHSYLSHLEKGMIKNDRPSPFAPLYFRNMGYIAMNLDSFEQSIRYFKQSISTCEDVLCSSKVLADIFRAIGVTYKEMGNEFLSIHFKEKSIEKVEGEGDTSSIAYLVALNSIAIQYRDLGMYDLALSNYKAVLQGIKERYGTDHPHTATLLTNLAKLYNELGDTKTAISNCMKALEIYRTYEDKENEYWVLYTLAESYLYENAFEKAEMYLKDCLSFYQSQNKTQDKFYTTLLNNYAEVLHFQGKDEKAKQVFKKSLELQDSMTGRFNFNYTNTANNLAELYIHQNQFKRAHPIVREVRKILDSIDNNSSQKSTNLYDLIRIQLEYGLNDSAITNTYSFLEIFNYEITHILPYLSERQHIFLLKRKLNQLRDIIRLFAEKTELKDQDLLQHLFIAHSNIKGVAFAINKEMRLSAKYKDSSLPRQKYIAWKEIKREVALLLGKDRKRTNSILDSLKHEAEELEKELLGNVHYEAMSMEVLHHIMSDIPRNVQVLDFLLFEDNRSGKRSYFCFVIDRENGILLFPFYTSEITQQPLKPNLELAQIFDRYLNTSSTKLYIIPDGDLHFFPFETLSAQKRNAYLYDNIEINYLNRFTDIESEDRNSNNIEYALVIGGLQYAQKTTNLDSSVHLQFLPGSLKEARKVANVLGKKSISVKLMTGCSATKDLLSQHLSVDKPNIIHLSTHGLLFEDRNKYSYYDRGLNEIALALSSCKQDENIFLTALECGVHDFYQTDLVFLSACNSGLGPTQYGDNVFGFQRVFQAGGARNILLTIREIPDIATYVFTSMFYEKLSEGHTINQSYHYAKRKLMDNYEENVWGAFKLIGRGDETLVNNSNSSFVFIALGIAMFLSLVFFGFRFYRVIS